MQAKQSTEQLVHRLEEIVTNIRQFEKTLNDEFHALKTDDWQQLTAIVTSKQAQIDTISAFESSIIHLQQHNHPDISALQRNLADSIRSCHTKNQKNFKLVAAKLRQTTRLIQLLQGAVHTHHAETYNAAGHASKAINTNEILVI